MQKNSKHQKIAELIENIAFCEKIPAVMDTLVRTHELCMQVIEGSLMPSQIHEKIISNMKSAKRTLIHLRNAGHDTGISQLMENFEIIYGFILSEHLCNCSEECKKNCECKSRD